MKRILIAVLTLFTLAASAFGKSQRPNVVLVITDDQGYGDVGAHGNPMIRTPNLDKLHGESVRLTNFHVDPTCSPTRAALMSGNYSTRTGVWHTILGRSILFPGQTLMPKVFKENGYRTAIFGKWHLGDNHPARPQDVGFDEVLIHGGGGIGQTPDHWGNDYFSDTYLRNGSWEKHNGYCTDVFFDEAMAYMSKKSGDPFFVYLPLNVPHGPFNVADRYTDTYRDKMPENMAKFYGMIENFDENMGRLREYLDQTGLAENTVFIFMTDNGTAAGISKSKNPKSKYEWEGYNADMRATKGSQYDGGHRVPFFLRWPAGGISKGSDVARLTAHIDVLPTLADLCGLKMPERAPLDGKSLVPLIKGGDAADQEKRTLFVHTQREDIPPKWVKSAAMTDRWRLVDGKELYEIGNDPGQEKDVASKHPDVVQSLRADYERWWASLAPAMAKSARIEIGTAAEPNSVFTCMDWHSEEPVPWNQELVSKEPWVNGFWLLDVTKPGRYQVTLSLYPEESGRSIKATKAGLTLGSVAVEKSVEPVAQSVSFEVDLKETGPARLDTFLKDEALGKQRGAFYVSIKRL